MPVGLPSDLLERRPDIVAAERRVAAAFHRIQEAKAARLPKIALTTGVSAISSELFVLKDHDNPVWNLGANLLMPIFQGGALKTQVEIRTVEQKQALAAYAGVGLRAFGEVENALTNEIVAREREQILAQTMADNQRAFEIVQHAVQRRQDRPALRLAASAGAQRDAVVAHSHAGRTARPARQPAPRARRRLRTAPARPQPLSPSRYRVTLRRSHACVGDVAATLMYIVCDGSAIAVPARSTISVTLSSSCSWSSRKCPQSRAKR